jgi:hypothetical protein
MEANGILLENYLDIQLGPMIQGGLSTGTSTTRNATGSSYPDDVQAWTTILADLPHFNGSIARQSWDTDELRFTLPRGKRVTSEARINAHVSDAATFVSNSCGDYDATDTAQRVTGNPDVRIYDTSNNDEIKIVGEVKTFWAFPIDENLVGHWAQGEDTILEHGTSLHDHLIANESHVRRRAGETARCWCSHNLYSLQRKVYEAIRQINGYMVNNGLMYGFLTTWRRWWFLRTDGSTLSVSRAFPHDHRNPTICQLLGRFLLATRVSFKFESPASSEIEEKIENETSGAKRDVRKKRPSTTTLANPRRSQRLIEKAQGRAQDAEDFVELVFTELLKRLSSDPDVLQYFLLSLDRKYIGYGRTGSVWKAVVRLGKAETVDVVLKIADVLKCPELEEELLFEAQVYKKLESLQGKCIPRLFVDEPIWFYRVRIALLVCCLRCLPSHCLLQGITKCLIMSYEGESLKTVNANTIPLKIREKARNDCNLIHEMGVYLTDMKKSNVCWNIDRQLFT